MILFPAIDLKNNQCVRLIQGDFNQKKVYDKNPSNIAKNFENNGAEYLHVVDLDAAQNADTNQLNTIQSIRSSVQIPIQVGGGIRTIERAKNLLDIGINRIIIGTSAIENFEFLTHVVKKYPNQIIVSIDAKNGWVATKGWTEVSQVKAIDLCKKLEQIGIKTIVYTDIAKDGMLLGPNFDDYDMLSKNTNLEIIASGGISSLSDLERLNRIGLYGAIIGKALYENKFTLKEALTCLQNVSSHV
ncbi:MAG: 1-(5-phosphoribosyl)-5-[(5-phosphoribosylamino)methylideneamino]imidazole-4-carboxamide isomerase [Tenericutes bacterium]|nr:1-(5-phosphoribosyl)-5-[(5-phosphoribosylamino)methylideneamino]imidazole-4-carboxamide isomerase [Mycoplasmatota bacterium]